LRAAAGFNGACCDVLPGTDIENQFTCEYPDYTLVNAKGIVGRKPEPMIKVRPVPLNFVLFSLCSVVVVIAVCPLCIGQKSPKSGAHDAAAQKTFGDEISGMYTFLREGEFVQITVENGTLSGFVSRYGDRESDKDAFLDQFFSKGSLQGKKIAFTTKSVHGTWYEFSGDVGRGDAKNPTDEGYWIIRGTLKKYSEDENKHVSAESRQVTFKSFPQDADKDEQPK
jgi:hypothetical protein